MVKRLKQLLLMTGVLLLFLGLGLAGLWYWQQTGPLWVSRQQVLLQRLQSLQRLEVLQAELLAYQSHQNAQFLNHSAFLIVAKGRAVYGLDLNKAEIRRSGEAVEIAVPAPRLQELIMNPADVEFVGVQKGWLTSQQAFETLKREAVIDLQADLNLQARKVELLQQAERNAQQYLHNLLSSLGFEQIKVVFTSRATGT